MALLYLIMTTRIEPWPPRDVPKLQDFIDEACLNAPHIVFIYLTDERDPLDPKALRDGPKIEA